VYEIDYVREALERTQGRLAEAGSPTGLDVEYVEANLDPRVGGSAIPLRSESVDAVLASLLLSYVSEPHTVLREARRVLRPGGRLVLSSMRRDADMSKLYTEGVAELRSGRAREIFGREGERQIDKAARGYLNLASRLLDLEEKGTFQFWDAPELAHLVRRAGFRVLSTSRALGDPSQAVVLSAERV
jgi:ubiquinone/menaquinone biosynthesis C-methylase UbiE